MKYHGLIRNDQAIYFHQGMEVSLPVAYSNSPKHIEDLRKKERQRYWAVVKRVADLTLQFHELEFLNKAPSEVLDKLQKNWEEQVKVLEFYYKYDVSRLTR